MASKRQDRLAALTEIDKSLWVKGVAFAGMDEVGRGPLAGDVVTACVMMPPEPLIEWVDDSKALSAMRREKVFEEISKIALFIGIGRASAQEIDDINILEATKLAMRRAAQNAPADLYLIDALEGLGLRGSERGIVHGDRMSYSIAAASIIAKVARDREMVALAEQYPMYDFAANKGYGTKKHIAALKEYGPCPLHRRSFIGHFL